MTTMSGTSTSTDAFGGARAHGPATAASAIPWATVLPLAAVMAYTDGFWVVSLRGAVGAIERTDAPFRTWLTESTVILPVFVFAVLGSLIVALRRRARARPRTRGVVAALVLVVMAGTVAGVAELVASSAYDYHLQSAQLDLMGSMGGTCVAACGEQMHHATLALQVRAVGYGSGLILMSNVLVVGWVVALRGGRITLIRRRTPRSASTWQRLLRLRRVAGSSTDHRHHLPGRPADLAVLMAAALASAGLLHAAVVPEHLAYWPAAGVFFVLLAGAQLAAAGALVFLRARRLVVLGAVVVSVGPLPLWLCSRSIGIPVGPQAGTPEPVGLADSAAGVLQLGACWSVSSSCAPGRGHLDLPRSSSSGLRSWVSWPSPPSAWAGAV